jgi:histidinol phosphatase-like PHP family hydrolase
LQAVTNAEIAAALEELGTLYERDGADRYRVRAYRTAARAIRDHPGSVAELARAGRVKQIPGIGKTLEEKIQTLLETGDIPSAAKLREKMPAATAELDSFLAENPAEGLVELSDIRGDLHTHTTLSDGRNTLEEMAEAARGRGYAYLAITDHSASHGFGDNVTAERLWERIEEIREWNRGRRGFRLLAGSEVNIGVDGALDYPEDLLAALDWTIASVHTSFSISEERMTARIVAAIENPHVDCIGHLTGRLIGRREPYAVDVEAVVAAAAATGTMLEINGNPNRRDLKEEHAGMAAEAGAMVVLDTDAHGIETLDNMNYAVIVARGAGLAPEQVANTRGWRDFSRLTKR